MNSKGRLVLVSIIVFLLGSGLGFTGGILYYKYVTHRKMARFMKTGYQQMILDTFTREMNLTPEQRTAVDSILDKQTRGFKALFEESKPRYHALTETTRAEIKQLLTKEQTVKYDNLTEKWKKKMESWNKNKK